MHFVSEGNPVLKFIIISFAAILLITGVASAQISPQMSSGISGAKFVPAYTISERARAAQKVLKLASPPKLDKPVSLTPNAPCANDGSHLSIWKPSFVLGTPNGGEVGVNFWGIYNQGHVKVGFTQESAKSYLLDCRLVSAGDIAYKVYAGAGSEPAAQGEMPLSDGHLFIMVPAVQSERLVSVELWPTPVNAPMGFLGCEISGIKN
jgi:hypothetical protein